jgi:thioredoxin reductase (NADPH)
MIKEPEKYRNKKVVIAGCVDSALDCDLFLKDVASEVILVHRSTEFRGHLDSVQKVMDLSSNGQMKLMLNSEITHLDGIENLNKVGATIKGESEIQWVEADCFLPLFGLSPKLGPIADWGLNINKIAIEVNTLDYSTNIPGIYAVGDINTYEGKLKLILCGFHEATMMVQSAFKRIYPNKNLVLKYTTVNGIQGF